MRFVGLLGHDIQATQGYSRWRASEARFFDELRMKLAIPQLDAVRRVVESYDEDKGPPAELPT